MKRYLIYLAYISLGTLLFINPSTTIAKSSNSASKRVLSSETQINAPKTVKQSPEAQTTASDEKTVVAASTPPIPPVSAPVAPPAPDPNNHLAVAEAAGIPAADFSYVDFIVSHESGWCATKWQGEYYCPGVYAEYDSVYDSNEGYGMCQSTPAVKMSTISADWATNPVTQLEWCNAYAIRTYGGWYGAYIHWINNGNW